MLYLDRHTVREILGSAAQATSLRNEVINHNIANAQTPGFNRSIVEFEEYLQQELAMAHRGREINLQNTRPRISTSNEISATRMDGNNVDIELEMAALFQNATRYEALLLSMINNSMRIDTVLNANI